MSVVMTDTIDRVEVITRVQRRRRWSTEEKAAIVQETNSLDVGVADGATAQCGAAPGFQMAAALC
jgi:hypothetical protein